MVPMSKAEQHMSRGPKAEDQSEKGSKELAMKALVSSISEGLTLALKDLTDNGTINAGNERVLLNRSRRVIDSTLDHFKDRVINSIR